MTDFATNAPTGDTYEAPRVAAKLGGAGNSPSTFAGLYVVAAVLFLAAARKSFKRYM